MKCDKCNKDIRTSNLSNVKYMRKVDKRVEEIKLDLCDTCKYELDTYMHDCLSEYVEHILLGSSD